MYLKKTSVLKYLEEGSVLLTDKNPRSLTV